MNVVEPPYKTFYADSVPGRVPRVFRARALAVCAGCGAVLFIDGGYTAQ